MITIDANSKHHHAEKYLALIEFEQIQLTYKQLPALALISISSTTLLSIIFWEFLPHTTLIILYTISLLPLTIFPLICAHYFKKVAPKFKNIKNWDKLLILLYFTRSCTWGLIGIMLYEPYSLANQITLLVLLIGVTLFQIRSISGYKPVFYVSAYPLLLPFMIRLLFEFTITTIAISALAFFMMFIFTLFFRKIHHSFIETSTVGFEKTQLADDLAKANLDKSRFLAAASHDLRQPLHAQGLYIAELKKNVTSIKAKNIVESLEKSTNAMRIMFDTLLDISKLDAGVVKPDIQHFPVRKIFDELHLDFSGIALDKNLDFRVVESDSIVKSDPILLSRIIRNMVTNAIKYTNTGGILLGCRRKAGLLSIEIWDTGIGISPVEQQNIFQEYLQLNNTERDRNKGLGLGLTIVKRLAKLLNHPITLKSTIQKGSVFSIAVTSGNLNEINYSKSTLSEYFTSDLQNFKILIIDDDSVILEAMQWLLEGWGCIVVCAESAKEAIQRFNNNSFIPDIIIADYRLRNNKTGVEAIQSINTNLIATIPAILITGDTSPSRIEEAQSSGYKILHKPVAPDKLRSLLSYYKNTAKLI